MRCGLLPAVGWVSRQGGTGSSGSMRTFFQIFLWSIAIQGMLFVFMAPQGCIVPNHLFAFPLAPSIAVGIAAYRRCSLERALSLMLLAYVVAIAARFAWVLTPWWSMDL